jgi:hypothetical protein
MRRALAWCLLSVIVGSFAWVVMRGSVVAPPYAALAALWLSTGALFTLAFGWAAA